MAARQRRFGDRVEAGERLAEVLAQRVQPPVIVLAIPRGGVVVGACVAERLDAPLDVVVPRKVGAPGNPELAVGAVAEGVEAIDEAAVRRLGLDIAAAHFTRRAGAARVLVAVPVGPAELEQRLRPAVDEVVVLQTPDPYLAVGQAYVRFPQVGDDEVLRCLEGRARAPR